MIFYKPTKYKQTAIGQVPEEWEVKEVKDIFIVKNGTTPSTKVNDYWENGNIDWITPEDLSKVNGQKRFFESRRKITETALKETRVNLLNPGDIILSTRAPVGYVAVLTKRATFNQGCRGLVAKQKEKVDPFFFAYLLDFYNKKLQDLSGGSTFKELSKSVLEGIKLQVPSFPEQQKISEVLSKIDEVIETVNVGIERWQKIKKAAMRQLLTRGIGHKKFKYVEGVGDIPEEWEVKRLGDLLKIERGASPRPITKYLTNSPDGVPWIKIGDVEESTKYITKTKEKITREGAKLSREVKKGDFLLSNSMSFGRPYILDIDGCIHDGWLLLRNEYHNILSNDYLYVVLGSSEIKKEFFKNAGGSTVKNLNSDIVKRVRIPIPSLLEQQKIADILQKIDEVIETRQQKKKHLERVKREMMKLLLAGRVRIKV